MTPQDFGSSYGPYAFGVLAMVIVVGVLVGAVTVVWTRVIRPMMREQSAIATANAATASELRVASEHLRECLKAHEATLEALSREREWSRPKAR